MVEAKINQETGNKKRTIIKWIVPLISILIIFAVGLLANYRQTLSAGSIPSTTSEELIQQSKGGQGQYQEIEKMARTTDKFAMKPSIWPVSGEVTSGFGWRISPWGGDREFHPGIDIANNMGTPIVATADGEVVQSGWSEGYGNIVEIKHDNGISTIYGHNSQIAVNVGQSVRKGQIIAYLGSTGRSTGPHAHYEVRVNGTAVDPISFLVLY